jgi:aspartate aminotransferase
MPRGLDGRGVQTHEQYHLWVGTPTWPNHIPLLGSAGFEIAEYPYYDTATREVNIDLMLETLRQVPAGDWWCFTAAVTTPLAPI